MSSSGVLSAAPRSATASLTPSGALASWKEPRTARDATEVPRFFIESDQVSGDSVSLRGDQARHLAGSLRAKPGDVVVVVEGRGTEHGVRLTAVSGDAVSGTVVWSRPATGEPSLRVHVLQAVPARGMDDAVEALAIIGVTSITPVVTSRTVARPGGRAALNRLQRWRTIATEAAQLAGRAQPPRVEPITPLSEALAALPADCSILACVLEAEMALSSLVLRPSRPCGLVIGPEGGLDAQERDLLRSSRALDVHLGPRTVPSRLAGFLAAGLVLARAGDLAARALRAPDVTAR